MQPIAIFKEVVAVLGIDVEIVIFLCSLVVYFILKEMRKPHQSKKAKCGAVAPKQQNEPVAKEGGYKIPETQDERDELNARFAQIEKNLHLAFESEDLFQALRCWYAMKKFKQCSPRYLSQIIKTMQSCNKTDEFIVMELRDYLWKHPRQRTPATLNDVLEPLARQLDYSELVNSIIEMASILDINKDARTYEILLTMYVAKQEAKKAQELITEMNAIDVEFTPCALVAVMTMALQLGKLDVALKAFRKLKASWDVRSTWAVSPFALQRHKANTLKSLLELASRKRRLVEMLLLLENMTLPEEVMTLVNKEFTSLSDIEATSMCKVLAESSECNGTGSNSNKFMKCLEARSKALRRLRQARVDSDASTSEGSRSDSEDDSASQCAS